MMEGKNRDLCILLLDDCEIMHDLVGEMLSSLGIAEVLTALDGEQGLAILDARPTKPDALLCDLSMPGMDGIEFLRHLADRRYEGGIILFSAAESSVLKAAERLARAHGLNILDVLEKPLDPAALATALARERPSRPKPVSGTEPLLSPQELREGLAAGQLELFYQPKVAVSGRRMLGVECLARWRHPTRGLLSPAAFIPVIEDYGMIDPFTLALFRQALAQQRDWLARGHDIRLNVNLSMDNLLRVDLPEVLDDLVRGAGLSAQKIVLEITESRLMDNLKLSLDVLIRLRLKGFGLSIDDFGTGYSTMEKLKQLPFTELKIDRCFVNGAATDATARAILDSSVRLGRIFGLNLVAEGVETQQDWDAVAASGCDEMQGYFIARPMPAAALIDWKDTWEGKPERENYMDNMDETGDKASILVVDDDSTMQEMFDAALGDHYRIAAAASGEEALAAIRAQRPDVVLLDVEMPPGIDGYETCRRLKEDDATADIPVIFISAHDSIEDRLKGYEAGGEDYVIKPVDTPELEAKIAHLLKAVAERASLKQMASYASTTAMSAMTSLSEMGALLEAMKRFGSCTDYPSLADAVQAGLALYGLQGAVQIRSPEGTLTRAAQGAATPLEASVISHMASMERIVHFKTRMSITYPRISLLVKDMPADDPDRCGRLRDHLAMLAEGAEARAEAIQASTESRRRGVTIERTINHITTTLEEIDRSQRDSQVATRLAVEAVTRRIENACISVALSTTQEDYMAGILKEGIEHLLGTQTDLFGVQNRLSSIVRELKGIAAG